jgi:hypothetical protein
MLDRESILRAEDLPRERVDVPEWGGSVWVRAMTAAERDALDAAQYLSGDDEAERLRNFRARVAVATICDENGKLLFSPQDVELLGRKSSVALERICRVAFRLNGLTEKALEQAKKN